MDAVAAAGGEPCPFYRPAPDGSYDGLLLCGGADLDPAVYGQENTSSWDVDQGRDKAETALVRLYLEAGKPILGICRGHQLVNAVLGGTLLQDIGPERRGVHHHREEDPYKVHPVLADAGSLLHRLYGPVFPVNSSHHQALDKIGTGLAVTARSEDGLAEAAEHVSLPVLCVQFHPERMCCSAARPDTVDGAPLFQWLIERIE